MESRLLYKEALAKWGHNTQIAVFAEECSEASAAAIRYLYRNRGDSLLLVDEVADVEIMCEQMRLLLGDRLIDTAKKQKLDRLEKRLML